MLLDFFSVQIQRFWTIKPWLSQIGNPHFGITNRKNSLEIYFCVFASSTGQTEKMFWQEKKWKLLTNRMTFSVQRPQNMEKNNDIVNVHGEFMQMENVYRNNFNYDGVYCLLLVWNVHERRSFGQNTAKKKIKQNPIKHSTTSPKNKHRKIIRNEKNRKKWFSWYSAIGDASAVVKIPLVCGREIERFMARKTHRERERENER